MERFDYEHFDYEKAYREMEESLKKPNIFLCGRTGAGKSSLVNDFFHLPKDMGAVVGEVRPQNHGIREYAPGEAAVVLVDTEGYEIGKDADFKKDILSEIDRRFEEAPLDTTRHIHCAWYCVNAGSARFLDMDKEIIEEIEKRKVPVMIVLTQVDSIDVEGLGDMRARIGRLCPGQACFTYSTQANALGWDTATKTMYVQKAEMIEWAQKHLPDYLQNNFMRAVKGEIGLHRKFCMRSIVLPHALMAGATVAGTSFVEVPFTDSLPLMGLQIKMVMGILNEYGIDTNVSGIIKDMTGSSLVSYVGKTLATQIIGIIPFAGQVAKSIVNVSVAASVTAVLGGAVSYVCEGYVKTCVDNGGAPTMDFLSYFDSDQIKAAMQYVGAHKADFYIDEILSKVVTKKK